MMTRILHNSLCSCRYYGLLFFVLVLLLPQQHQQQQQNNARGGGSGSSGGGGVRIVEGQQQQQQQSTAITTTSTPKTPAEIQQEKCEGEENATLQHPRCNSCLETSIFPGCNDLTCTERICSDLNETQCCTTIWSLDCVAMAEILCFPEIIPWPLQTSCPNGYICEESNNYGRRMSNCNDIQELPKRLLLGNLLGGIHCPEHQLQFSNCPIGQYCPTPDQNITCPETKFCPHKSSEPWIDCSRCKEGSTELKRGLFGYIFFSITTVLILVTTLIVKHEKYKSDMFAKQLELLARQANSFNISKRRKLKQEQLERLKPKLDIIARRLGLLDTTNDGSSSTNEASSSIIVEETNLIAAQSSSTHSIVFDTKKLYDILDKDSDGCLSYQELNAVLDLNPHELQNFVSRMRELGGSSSSSGSGSGGGGDGTNDGYSTRDDTVSRPVFVRHFLQVLEETSHLSVSTKEAAELWDHIEKVNGGKGYVEESMLYTSSISSFLSDQQIYVLLKKLRQEYKESMSARDGTSSNRRTSSRMSTNEDSTSQELRLLKRQSMIRSIRGGHNAIDGKVIILRSTFSVHYPRLLIEVTTNMDDSLAESMRPIDNTFVDICFQNLSLAVEVAGKQINVVDNVTGRLQEQTMTALMGGSGAGKTSLLNALCGRAYYGEVLGEIYINGQKKDIGEIADSVGFVPQDDIVYAELTVRENLIYTGKFLLPNGTKIREIEELADETLAGLGLSRVANSLVGDVKRRGVSGGEKKRVNIGLELMKRPSVLFLDEPTSGLDASSALLVMQSLKHLVNEQGVTIVSVIHQPRKFIFDLFDSLILLGVGGKMVYHGPTSMANDYFYNLNYVLPQGESVADWLIDISSGRLEPELTVASTPKEEKEEKKKLKKMISLVPTRKKRLSVAASPTSTDAKPSPKHALVKDSSQAIEVEVKPEELRDTEDSAAVGSQGVSNARAEDAFEAAKVRRAWLYDKWNNYFENLSEEEKECFEKPESSRLPQDVVKQSFASQLYNQTTRALLVSKRNYLEKLIDTSILVVATIILCVMSGLPTMTLDYTPDVSFEEAVRPTDDTVKNTLIEVFSHTAVRQIEFPLKVGIITAVLMGLQSTKVLTNKRLEFFREASSGYDINAYFMAINVVATLEHSVQAVIIAFFASWIRDPIANWWSLFIHFIMLTWVCISWGLFVPMVFPPDNVVIIIGFFMAFCGLMLAGALPPVTYLSIYEGGFTEHMAAWLSPTRFFYEALIVGDLRCLPEQMGTTVDEESINFPRNSTITQLMGLAGHDINSTSASCYGWYWTVLPAFMVGLTVRFAAGLAMHTFNRSQQTKKPLLYEMKRNPTSVKWVVAMVVTFLILFIASVISYTVDRSALFETSEDILDQYDVDEDTVRSILKDAQNNASSSTDWDDLLGVGGEWNTTIPPEVVNNNTDLVNQIPNV